MRCARCEGTFDWIPAHPHLMVPRVTPALSVTPVTPMTPTSPTASEAPEAQVEDWIATQAPQVEDLGRDALVGPARVASAVEELAAEDATPQLVARLAVEELVNARADGLLAAYDAGELFARFGPELLAAWDHCRRRLGEAADPAMFRSALNARLGIDLPGWVDR